LKNPSEHGSVMPPLIRYFLQHARKRTLFNEEVIQPEQIFALVRDMPYAQPTHSDPATIMREWRGTCAAKHFLLQTLFTELGIRSTIMACTQVIHLPDRFPLPPALRELIDTGPPLDVHAFLSVPGDQNETLIDATWPLPCRAIGLPVNEHLVWGQSMTLVNDPIDIWAIAPWQAVEEVVETLLRTHLSDEERKRRDRVIALLSDVLASVAGTPRRM
jgi:hypothetical protein